MANRTWSFQIKLLFDPNTLGVTWLVNGSGSTPCVIHLWSNTRERGRRLLGSKWSIRRMRRSHSEGRKFKGQSSNWQCKSEYLMKSHAPKLHCTCPHAKLKRSGQDSTWVYILYSIKLSQVFNFANFGNFRPFAKRFQQKFLTCDSFHALTAIVMMDGIRGLSQHCSVLGLDLSSA